MITPTSRPSLPCAARPRRVRTPSTAPAVIATLLAFVLPACSSGGGGGGVGVGRTAGSVVFRTEDLRQLIGVADDGTKVSRALSVPAMTQVRSFAVSPDGGAVAYVADVDVQDRYELYVRDLAAAAPRKVSVLENNSDDVFDFAWAPDSASLAYRANGVNADAQMFRVGRDGANFYKVYFHGVVGIEVAAGYVWSPDSRYLAFGIEQTGPVFDLRLHDAQTNATGATQVEFTPAGRDVRDVTFSPDSRWIAYRTDENAANDQYEVFRRPVDLSSAAVRSNGATGSTVQIASYSWSPDSRYLAQHVKGFPGTANVGINVFEIANGTSTRIASSTQIGVIAWASQSDQLAAAVAFDPTSGPVADMRLLVFDATTLSGKTVSRPLGSGEVLLGNLFAWSPDDMRLAYATQSNGLPEGQLYLAMADGSQTAVPVTGMQGTELFALSWSPDSRHLGALELNQTQAFHPGEWHLIDTSAQSVWRSGSGNTFSTSRMMLWSPDSVRAIYSIGAPGNNNELLFSTTTSSTGLALTSAVADTASGFTYASAPLPPAAQQ